MSGLADRARQLRRLWQSEGPAGILRRTRVRLATRLAPVGSTPLPIGNAEFEAAARLADAGWQLPGPSPRAAGEPLRVAWVCTPPTPGSGGHTTMFRLVNALTDAGHDCTVYLVDNHGWDLRQHTDRIRLGWPDVRAEVRDFAQGVSDCHAIFATGWDSAWTVLRTDALGLRCYLVQDFEPSFYPAGSEYLLAEATYRFGFQGVTAGNWLREVLTERYDMPATGFEFGCDLDRYVLGPRAGDRPGICYYCRPITPRRAHELALAALRLFAGRNPSVPIHFYGQPVGDVGFPITQHGVLGPDQLNDLYNSCAAGLVLSATNVSLVPQEMLAAGCIPVVNDAGQNRLVLHNDLVSYAEPTPVALTRALEDLVTASDGVKAQRAAAAASSVSSLSWTDVGKQFVLTVEKLVEQATN